MQKVAPSALAEPHLGQINPISRLLIRSPRPAAHENSLHRPAKPARLRYVGASPTTGTGHPWPGMDGRPDVLGHHIRQGYRRPVAKGRDAGAWTPEEFRAHGYAVIDWVADYMERVGSLPVAAPAAPGAVRAALPGRAPAEPEPFAGILADLDRVVLPGITHWQSPSFFGFFPANASGPSILGEL